jgi:hypothetical protein
VIQNKQETGDLSQHANAYLLWGFDLVPDFPFGVDTFFSVLVIGSSQLRVAQD